MPVRTYSRFLAFLALALLALPPAAAQTLARFVPAELGGEGASAGMLELRFVRESTRSIELQPWPALEIGWLFVRGEGTQQNHDALATLPGDPSRLRLEHEGSGPLLAGWDLPARVERAHPVELRAFLAERSARTAMPRALEALAANETVLVRRLESLALVARPEEGQAPAEPSAIATSKSGQRMELRPLFDPSFLQAGSDFAFKLYLPAGGSEGVLCRAVHLVNRSSQPIELLGDGSLRLKLEQAGPWMLEATRLRALGGAEEAALELASSTLVFVVRPSSAPAKEGKGR